MIKQFAQRQRIGQAQGQSLVEIALFLPILLLLLAGFVEIGVLVNGYINLMDSSRAAARYVSPLDPTKTQCIGFDPITPNMSSGCTNAELQGQSAIINTKSEHDIWDACRSTTTTNFFYVTGCMVLRNMPDPAIDPGNALRPSNGWDDIVIYTIPIKDGAAQPGGWRWSFFGNHIADTTYVDDAFNSQLNAYASAPATGMVVVEVYHRQPQFLKIFSLNIASDLTGGGAILPDPVPMHVYTVFPLIAIEPK